MLKYVDAVFCVLYVLLCYNLLFFSFSSCVPRLLTPWLGWPLINFNDPECSNLFRVNAFCLWLENLYFVIFFSHSWYKCSHRRDFKLEILYELTERTISLFKPLEEWCDKKPFLGPSCNVCTLISNSSKLPQEVHSSQSWKQLARRKNQLLHHQVEMWEH
jgi:hypothetical protein